jgi:hypothetical protein
MTNESQPRPAGSPGDGENKNSSTVTKTEIRAWILFGIAMMAAAYPVANWLGGNVMDTYIQRATQQLQLSIKSMETTFSQMVKEIDAKFTDRADENAKGILENKVAVRMLQNAATSIAEDVKEIQVDNKIMLQSMTRLETKLDLESKKKETGK